MSGAGTHRELREQLGVYALGLLPPEEVPRLRAHLDGCPECRAELAELAPLAADLRLVDPDRLPGPAAPPRALGERVLTAVREESLLREHRERRLARRGLRRAVLVPAAAAVLAAGVASGVTYGLTRPDPAPPAAAPAVLVERLPLTVVAADVRAAGPAVVVPHTWGVEVTFAATGFAPGRTYRALVRTVDGAALPAGEFLGVGARELTCDMQAAVLRADAVAFEVVDEAGGTVLTLPLPRA
ncbi:anti-sigma factor family protein [Kineococcus indalonis]|uniref:anti-sigma factor family protein n=1 Tax=Kineococcus indalonis TaxID=2696566 RepID=UPI00141250A1|nr:zf-HC2 domain-containing protein [Kineococcus indalonis]NAZ87895.1 anti-sigma factor [Kineococcus indalonis]